ncbi:MAG: cytidylate kinase-like family protein [Eubacterium sp.]|nr:cytidylate kinase-like family protein [Eubacterium sp.]
MEYKNIEEEIANRIYDLDNEAYKSCKSDLGKLYSGSRANSIHQIIQTLKSGDMHEITNEIMLISNMINTVPKGEEFNRLNEECVALNEIISNYVRKGITADIEMDEYSLPIRYKDSNSPHTIISIGREFGSGGHEIGYLLAQKLGFSFYDKEILTMANSELGLDASASDESTSTLSFGASLAKKKFSYFGITTSDALFFKQSELIIKIAQREDCVILGRCADVILQKEGIACHSIYIGAPIEARIARKMKIENISEEEAKKLVKSVDKKRRDYYNHYTGRKWGHSGNYDLSISSAALGIDGTVDMILRMVNKTLAVKDSL